MSIKLFRAKLLCLNIKQVDPLCNSLNRWFGRNDIISTFRSQYSLDKDGQAMLSLSLFFSCRGYLYPYMYPGYGFSPLKGQL